MINDNGPIIALSSTGKFDGVYHLSFIIRYTGCPRKTSVKEFLGKTGQFFSKLFLNYKIYCISTSFKRRICILSHIGKKLQAGQFFTKVFFQIIFFYFSKTVLVIHLTLYFEFLGQKMTNLCTFH